MKKYRVITTFTAIAFATLFTSCGTDGREDPEKPVNPVPQPTEPIEIVLSTTVQAQSKATFPATDTQLPARQTIAVWVYKATADAPQLYGRNILTANGSGGLSGGEKMYFPGDDNNIHIYALHANTALSGSDYPAEDLTHTVNSDQRLLDDYAASDLLYARKTDVRKSPEVVPLVFHHLLAKLQVAISLKGDLSGSEVESVTINGTRLQAGYTLSRTQNPEALTIIPGGQVSPITIGADISANFSAPQYNDAIVVPQTVPQNTPFIVLRLMDGLSLAYVLSENTTFESGKKYLYHITLSKQEISVSTSVQDWSAGGLVEGEAGLLK